LVNNTEAKKLPTFSAFNSKVAPFTDARISIMAPGNALSPPIKLSLDYIMDYSGDPHGPPDEHRKLFPDDRTGSHSALATQKGGQSQINTVVGTLTIDYLGFINS
jgi:creatinine amidohydrolase